MPSPTHRPGSAPSPRMASPGPTSVTGSAVTFVPSPGTGNIFRTQLRIRHGLYFDGQHELVNADDADRILVRRVRFQRRVHRRRNRDQPGLDGGREKNGGGVPLAEIVASECLKSGLLLASDIDTSALSQTVRGYRIGTVASIRSALEPLQGAYPFDVVQSGYTVSFRPRGGAAVATIPAADLDARPAGKERGVALTLSREMDSQPRSG